MTKFKLKVYSKATHYGSAREQHAIQLAEKIFDLVMSDEMGIGVRGLEIATNALCSFEDFGALYHQSSNIDLEKSIKLIAKEIDNKGATQ